MDYLGLLRTLFYGRIKSVYICRNSTLGESKVHFIVEGAAENDTKQHHFSVVKWEGVAALSIIVNKVSNTCTTWRAILNEPLLYDVWFIF